MRAEFRRAISEYYRSTPQATRQLPARLEDLLEDRRSGATRRHLRRIYLDPLTGKPEWGLVKQGDRVSGVYSLAGGAPVRRAGFAKGDDAFAGASSYAQWRFIATDLQANPSSAIQREPSNSPSAGLPPAPQPPPLVTGVPPVTTDVGPHGPVENAATGIEKPTSTLAPAVVPGLPLSREPIGLPGNRRDQF